MSPSWVPMFKPKNLDGALRAPEGHVCRVCGNDLPSNISPMKHLKSEHTNKKAPQTAADFDDPNVEATIVSGQVYVRKEYIRFE